MDLTLAKRRAGSPLSEAELEQRRNAARRRRRIAVDAVVGLGSAAIAADLTDTRLAQAIAQRKAAVLAANDATVGHAVRRRAARREWVDRYTSTAARIPGATADKFVPEAIRLLDRKRGKAVRALIEHIKPYAEERDGGYLTPSVLEGDARVAENVDEAHLSAEANRLATLVSDLKNNARAGERTSVLGHVARVPEHTRNAPKGSIRTIWPRRLTRDPDFLDKTRHEFTSDVSGQSGAFTLRDVEEMLTSGDAGAEVRAKEMLRNAGLPRPVIRRSIVPETVGAHLRVVPTKIRRGEPYPPRDARRRIANELDEMRSARTFGVHTQNYTAIIGRMAAARAAKRPMVAGALRQAAVLRRLRGPAAGIAAIAAAAGGASLAHIIQEHFDGKLKKAAPEEPPADKPADPPAPRLAAKLAETFKSWIARILGEEGKSIDLQGDLERAMKEPIESAFVEGAKNPPIRGEDSKIVAYGFDQLDPKVLDWAEEYSNQKVVEISEEQRDRLKVIVHKLLSEGRPPARMAQDIKLVVGLTDYQSSLVDTFRTQLQTLDPRALQRKLRDARFDRTVRKAIDTDTKLPDEVVDKMVDAYHRRAVALRAVTIGRTESLRAANFGAWRRVAAFLDEHPDMDVIKVWMATEDDRTREDHRELDGKEVRGIETPFVTQEGDELRMPLDDQAPARQVVNCRCTMYYRLVPRHFDLRFMPSGNQQ